MIESLLLLAVTLLLAWPLGVYLARLLDEGPGPFARVFAPVEGVIYVVLGVDPKRGMTWQGYARAFVATNVALGLVVWLMLMFQHRLPLNPDGIAGMNWHTALHTMVSFVTNTNQQHYSGQAQLSYLSQLAGIVTLQVVTPLMGLAIAAALLRALRGGRQATTRGDGEPVDVGNYYVDIVRVALRCFIPLAIVVSLALTWQGVPSTFDGALVATPVDATAGVAEQVIPRGPVAPMVAVKQLGTNGGGWYGPNSAVPLENPTPLSNFIEMLSIVLIPVAIAFMAGTLLRRAKFSALVVGVMLALSVPLVALAAWGEAQTSVATSGLVADGANFEGKEVRFGATASATWAALTTQTSNGSVNAMHDSLHPAGGLVTITGMLMNATWGGVGCGFVNFMVYLLLTVFLSGLLIGRTPEIFGRKLDVRDVRLLALLVAWQPLVILGLVAITLAVPGVAGTSNPGVHGIAQVFYEFTSAYANNGSGFEGLGDATPWWNVAASFALVAGRYLPLLLPLAVAASLGAKRVAPEGAGTLQVESVTFGATMIAVVVIVAVLSYLPALVLGPIGEWLAITSTVATTGVSP